MKYLIFSNLATARKRSILIARSFDCGKGNRDVTKFWLSIITNFSDPDQFALVIPDSEVSILSDKEQGRLQSHSFLLQAGWFPAVLNNI